MKYLAKYFAPYIPAFLLLAVFVWAQSYVNLTLPDYMSKIVNKGILLKGTHAIWTNGLVMLGITLLGGLSAVCVGFIAAKVSTGYVRRLREATFTKIERFSLSEFDSFSSSSLVTRTTNDMQQVQNTLAMVLRLVLLAPFMGVGSIIKAHGIAPSMSWIVYTAIGLLVSMIVILFTVAIPRFTAIQKFVDKLSLQAREMLTGVRVVRAYDNDAIQQDKFDQTNLASTRLNTYVNRLVSIMQPFMMLIMSMASLAVIWVGAYAINSGHLQIGSLLALTQYVMQTIFAFLMISIMFILVPRAAVSGRRINEVLATEPTINDPTEPKQLPKDPKGVLEFHNVSFGYRDSGQKVLSNMSFTAKPGAVTAIIGGTGSGKSTVLKLIPRLYDVTDGSITLDGIDIRDLTQHDLRSHIGYVPQKASLFAGTVSSNIGYGRPNADKSELAAAAETAQASEFINDLPKGLDNPISQAGSNVSGGQKQRLSIARALAKKAKVYLFDDSFSALDFKTDAALRKALKDYIQGTTFIIVAQRISTIMHADTIIVLDDGRIVGQGTHDELLRSSSVYREIAESQLSPRELKEHK
jgi:ATP-binding cassette subfamily B multidrug efflux pump